MAPLASQAYTSPLFAAFYDAMVASLPPEFEVAESHRFYTDLTLTAPSASSTFTKILDLCTGTGSIPRSLASAWSSRDINTHPKSLLHITAVDNSEEMLQVASDAWTETPGVEVDWQVATLGQPGSLHGLEEMDIVLISAGSWHHLGTREEQICAMTEVKDALAVGGLLVINVFSVEEIVGHEGLELWPLKEGFWKQTLEKEVESAEDGGILGRETFRVGCDKWEEDMVFSWTLRAVSWHEIRELCKLVGLVIKQEFNTFCDALEGRNAPEEEIEETGRIFVVQRQS